MGKGTIASGGTDGLYQVTLDYGQAARDARVAKVTADLAALVTKIADAQALLDAQQAIEDAQKIVVDAAINTYITVSNAVGAALEAVNAAQAALAALQADAFATPEDIAAAQTTLSAANDAYAGAKAAMEPALKNYTEAASELAKLKGKTAALRIPLELLKAQQVQLTKDLATWTALVLTETVPAWCADLTEDATGVVATIEIPGEDKVVLIAPEALAHVPGTDGILTAREAQTPEQVFFNAAILPGWQKYKPTYRRGTITSIQAEDDTADVALDASDLSSAQSLGINQSTTLTAVPVKYMSCDAGAFEVGDRCVVKFNNQNWDEPKIIGFVDNPKPCEGLVVLGLAMPRQVRSNFYASNFNHYLNLIYDIAKSEVKKEIINKTDSFYQLAYPHIIDKNINQLYVHALGYVSDWPLSHEAMQSDLIGPIEFNQKIISPCFDKVRKEVLCIDYLSQLKVQVLTPDYNTQIREFSAWGEGYAWTVSAHKSKAAIGGWNNSSYIVKIINHISGVAEISISLGDYFIYQVALTKDFLAVSCYNADNDAYLRLYNPKTGDLMDEVMLQQSDAKWESVAADGIYIAIMRSPSITWVNGINAESNERVRFYKYSNGQLVFLEERNDLFSSLLADFSQRVSAGGGGELEGFNAGGQAGR